MSPSQPDRPARPSRRDLLRLGSMTLGGLSLADHGAGHKRFLTGRLPAEPTGFVNDAPMVGSIVAKVRERRDVGVPNYVAGTDAGRAGVDVFSFGAAYLGQSPTPFIVSGDPS